MTDRELELMLMSYSIPFNRTILRERNIRWCLQNIACLDNDVKSALEARLTHFDEGVSCHG